MLNVLSGRGARILSETELDAVHATTLRILSQVGVRFDDAQAVSIFRQCSSAEVDGAVVRLNEKLVEQTIEQSPSKITLHARNPKFSLERYIKVLPFDQSKKDRIADALCKAGLK